MVQRTLFHFDPMYSMRAIVHSAFVLNWVPGYACSFLNKSLLFDQFNLCLAFPISLHVFSFSLQYLFWLLSALQYLLGFAELYCTSSLDPCVLSMYCFGINLYDLYGSTLSSTQMSQYSFCHSENALA
eukprot:767518_1